MNVSVCFCRDSLKTLLRAFAGSFPCKTGEHSHTRFRSSVSATEVSLIMAPLPGHYSKTAFQGIHI